MSDKSAKSLWIKTFSPGSGESNVLKTMLAASEQEQKAAAAREAQESAPVREGQLTPLAPAAAPELPEEVRDAIGDVVAFHSLRPDMLQSDIEYIARLTAKLVRERDLKRLAALERAIDEIATHSWKYDAVFAIKTRAAEIEKE